MSHFWKQLQRFRGTDFPDLAKKAKQFAFFTKNDVFCRNSLVKNL